MAEIRPLQRADLAEVVELLRAHMPGWTLNEEILLATTLDHPWSDEELPSLVAVDDEDAVIGFIGVQVRQMRCDDRPIKGVCCGDLIVSPDHRGGSPGPQLLSRVLTGPQDVTWSDSATDAVVGAWRARGGHVDHARAADFMLVLRPFRWLKSILGTQARRETVGRSKVPVGALPAHEPAGWISGKKHMRRDHTAEGHEASAAAIAERMPLPARGVRLAVAWDAPALESTLRQIRAVDKGVTCRLVSRRGRPIGWYVYVSRPGGVSRLLHLSAAERSVDAVLGDVIGHATEAGSTVLAGRAEPHLEWTLRNRRAVLQFAWQPVIKAGDPEIAAILATGAALLTRLDGEISPI